jgi:hypothetical protein
MTDFTGQKFKLAGFNIRTKGTLVDVFAEFCGINDTPKGESYVDKNMIADMNEMAKAPGLLHIDGPRIPADEIVELLVGKSELVPSHMDQYRLPGPSKEDLLKDIGPEKLALLLVEMGKARKTYLQGVNTFIPAAKLQNI